MQNDFQPKKFDEKDLTEKSMKIQLIGNECKTWDELQLYEIFTLFEHPTDKSTTKWFIVSKLISIRMFNNLVKISSSRKIKTTVHFINEYAVAEAMMHLNMKEWLSKPHDLVPYLSFQVVFLWWSCWKLSRFIDAENKNFASEIEIFIAICIYFSLLHCACSICMLHHFFFHLISYFLLLLIFIFYSMCVFVIRIS